MTQSSAPSAGPLAGVRVLEIGHYIAGPHAAQMLGDQGAEVIKLEPAQGDPTRRTMPLNERGDSLFFACHNRRKRSVSMDLSSPDAAAPLKALLAWADVVLTNYSYGVPEKLGFGFEQIQAVNPRAVMVHITGFNPNGPWRDYAAFDGSIMAMSGLADLTGVEDGPPLMSQALFADHSVGAHAAYATLCALAERDRTGRGRLVQIAMLDIMTSYLGAHIPSRGVLGLEPRRAATRGGTRFVHMFDTADGYIYLAAITVPMWRALATLLGHPEWAPADMTVTPDFVADRDLDRAAKAAAVALLTPLTSAEAMALLQSKGVTCGSVRSVSDLYDEEIARGSPAIAYVEMPSGGDPVPVPAEAFNLGLGAGGRVPSLGGDSAAVLEALGLAAEDIASLCRSGVVRQAEFTP